MGCSPDVALLGRGRERVSSTAFDELLARVASEPERVIPAIVSRVPPDLVAVATRRGGLSLGELLSSPGRTSEPRALRYRHVLGPPASQMTIEGWLASHPTIPGLPADLVALLERADGVHLWANGETGRSYVGLAPMAEWELARKPLPAADPADVHDGCVALSYHQDGASFVVLDARSGEYFLMDAAGPDRSSRIATSVDELLDWLWRSRIPPKST